MRTEVIMPQMGESVTEATILKWIKSVGDKVEKDETILEISTDKVDSEVPSPASGFIVEIKAEQGTTVSVRSVIAIIDSETASNSVQSFTRTETENQAVKVVDAISPNTSFTQLAKNVVVQHQINPSELSSIQGSGVHGKITKADVENYVETRPANPVSEPAQVVSQVVSAPVQQREISTPSVSNASGAYGNEGVRIETMDNMRKRIADHMVRSKATSPHVYSVAEVDVTNIAKWREKSQKTFLAREGFKLSFTPFFLEAVSKALIQYPYVNASVDGDKIVLKKSVNIGCAVALGTSGLIVPVIKNCDQLSLVGIARSLNDVANRARNKKLVPEDTQGGTFTLTNPGIFGNIMGLPIINQPQLAILGVGAIKKRPVVVDDMIAIRDIAYLTLSYDHRVIDGSLSGQFLQFITQYLQNWNMDREIF